MKECSIPSCSKLQTSVFFSSHHKKHYFVSGYLWIKEVQDWSLLHPLIVRTMKPSPALTPLSFWHSNEIKWQGGTQALSKAATDKDLQGEFQLLMCSITRQFMPLLVWIVHGPKAIWDDPRTGHSKNPKTWTLLPDDFTPISEKSWYQTASKNS